MDESLNVLGEPLASCSDAPLTGYYRDGCCNTGPGDVGLHTVCARMTAEFLEFTRAQGNDLTAPAPAFGFPGLKPGDEWCLCAGRWLEAARVGAAPPVRLEATHQRALEIVPIGTLRAHALGPTGPDAPG